MKWPTALLALTLTINSVAAASPQECTDAVLKKAWEPVPNSMSTKACAVEVGMTVDDLVDPDIPLSLTQIAKFKASANCKAYYALYTKGLASIKPPCLLEKDWTTADVAAMTFDDVVQSMLNALKSTTRAPIKECSTAVLDKAFAPVDTSSVTMACAADVGMTPSDLVYSSKPFTAAQLSKFKSSSFCQSYYALQQKAVASINPPCLVDNNWTTADWAKRTFADYVQAMAKQIPTTTQTPTPTTTKSATNQACSTAVLDKAFAPVLDSKATIACGEEIGLTPRDVLYSDDKPTATQVAKYKASVNCKAAFSLLQKAYAGISPVCVLSTLPKVVTTADAADFTFADFLEYLSEIETTDAPTPTSTKSALKGSQAGSGSKGSTRTTTPAPTSTSGQSLSGGLVTVAIVLVNAVFAFDH